MALDPIKRGDDRVIQVVTTWPTDVPSAGAEEGDPYSLTGKTVWFTAKNSKTLQDSDAVIQKKTGGQGIEIDSVDTNIAYVTIDGVDTESVRINTTLVCDVQVKNEAGKVFTVWEDYLLVGPDVTRGTT